jgi:plasmid stabilization system protein ParE
LLLACLAANPLPTLAAKPTKAAAEVVADSLLRGEIQALLDELGMGYSRREMEQTMLSRVRAGLRAQDSTLARSAEPHLEQVVRVAFDEHARELREFQDLVSTPLAQTFTRKEIQELTRTFRSPAVQRLLRQLQDNTPRIQERGAALFSTVGRDVQVFLRAKLAVEGAKGQQGPAVPPLLAAPPTGERTRP